MEIEFNAKVFNNKKNKQSSITIPKKKIKLKDAKLPKEVKVQIKW